MQDLHELTRAMRRKQQKPPSLTTSIGAIGKFPVGSESAFKAQLPVAHKRA
jgi:hypothetical protein